MKQVDANKILALAGIFQAAYLVNQIAFHLKLNEKAYQTSLQSIFRLDASDVISVFKGAEGLHLEVGLICISHKGIKKITLRYILHMLHIGKKILKNPALFTHLRRRLTPIISQATHLGSTHDIVIESLAALYKQVFIKRGLQIPVVGKAYLFKKTTVVNTIYALLIAGIRAAVLWYQVGGNRWELFFSKRKLRLQADFLLQHA